MEEGGTRAVQMDQFEILLDALDFALDNAIFALVGGKLIRQAKGIPMGDWLSPAMTIGTCAWMEREWMTSLHEDVKARFVAARYMDDILLLSAKGLWDSERFHADFQASECYMPPLKLEAGSDGTFLETKFEIEGDYIHFRLKNANEGGAKKVWRYQPFDSYTSSGQKCSMLVATLQKVEFMAGDEQQRFISAMHKLREFADLGYPVPMRKRACHRLGRETGRLTWLAVGAMQK